MFTLTTIIVSALGAPAPDASSAPTPSTVAYAQSSDLCAALGATAKEIMLHRQGGTSMREVLAVVDRDSPNAEIFEGMIYNAYAMPMLGSAEEKALGVVAFQMLVEDRCAQTMGK